MTIKGDVFIVEDYLMASIQIIDKTKPIPIDEIKEKMKGFKGSCLDILHKINTLNNITCLHIIMLGDRHMHLFDYETSPFD